jgi:hypothetical protein
MKGAAMQNEPIWLNLVDNHKENSLYLQMLSLIENKEEISKILSAAGCTGNCRGPGGCQ